MNRTISTCACIEMGRNEHRFSTPRPDNMDDIFISNVFFKEDVCNLIQISNLSLRVY